MDTGTVRRAQSLTLKRALASLIHLVWSRLTIVVWQLGLCYRRAMSLSPVPFDSQDLPLALPSIEPTVESMQRSAIHEIAKAVMRETAEHLRKQAPALAGMATHIERASTH